MAEQARRLRIAPDGQSVTDPPITGILKYYELLGVSSKALFWGILVVVVGFGIDYLFRMLHLPWLTERALDNLIEGAIFTILVWVLLKAREKRLQRRFKEVGYLNHHIRNSLTVIELAEKHPTKPEEHAAIVEGASLRIRRCVERISREEDCEINPKSPQNPE